MKSIEDVDVTGKRVLIRLDTDVPVLNGKVKDDSRLRASLHTLHLFKKAKQIVMMGHMGRPTSPNTKFSLKPVAKKLSSLLKAEVHLVDYRNVPDKKYVLIENLRFYPGEKEKSKEFAKQLAQHGDVYVNDAFADCHREDASISLVPKYVPSFAGLHVINQVINIAHIIEKAKHPFILVIGGAKIDKLLALEKLVNQVDGVLIGGAMMYPFLKAMHFGTGKYECSTEDVAKAKKLLKQTHIMLPVDVMLDTKRAVNAHKIPPDRAAFDIGPETIKHYTQILRQAKTIIWNGPLGVAEKKAFAKGTNAVARVMAQSKGLTLVGGGDTTAAIKPSLKKFTFYSTAGGAFLDLLAGKKLPGLEVLR